MYCNRYKFHADNMASGYLQDGIERRKLVSSSEEGSVMPFHPMNGAMPPPADYHPLEPSSIPRHTQSVWLLRPTTPLIMNDVFNRRRNFVTSDLHVLLVTSDLSERKRVKADLDGVKYKVTIASSGKVAQAMLHERGGDFHVVMTSANLAGEGPDCMGLLYWIREIPTLREVASIVLGSYSIEPNHAISLVRAGASDILTRPIPVEALIRFRHLVGAAQSLTQQRKTRAEDGGTRSA